MRKPSGCDCSARSSGRKAARDPPDRAADDLRRGRRRPDRGGTRGRHRGACALHAGCRVPPHPARSRLGSSCVNPALACSRRSRRGFRITRRAHWAPLASRSGWARPWKRSISPVCPHPATRISSANVFWCAGTEARPAASWLGVDAARNGAVKVRPDCSIPGDDKIFAIGDVATLPDRMAGPCPALPRSPRSMANTWPR